MSDLIFEQPCPMCGEPISDESVECPQCGEELRLDTTELGADFDRKVIQKFHREARGLAGFWIFGGLLSIAVGGMTLSSGVRELMFYTRRETLVVLSLALIVSGCAWLWCGVLTARKSLRGVTVGLRVSYLSVLLNLAFLNVFGILALFVVILQALRVLKNGLLLQEAGLLGDRRGH